jgi:hypothetical protein
MAVRFSGRSVQLLTTCILKVLVSVAIGGGWMRDVKRFTDLIGATT